MAKRGGVESNVANRLRWGKSRKPKRCRRNRMHRGRRRAGRRPTQFRMASIEAACEFCPCVPRRRSMCQSMDQPAEMPAGVAAAARVTTPMPVPAPKVAPAKVSAAAVASPAPSAIRRRGNQQRQNTQQNRYCACRPRTETKLAGHDRPTPGTLQPSVLRFSGLAARAWQPVWTPC